MTRVHRSAGGRRARRSGRRRSALVPILAIAALIAGALLAGSGPSGNARRPPPSHVEPSLAALPPSARRDASDVPPRERVSPEASTVRPMPRVEAGWSVALPPPLPAAALPPPRLPEPASPPARLAAAPADAPAAAVRRPPEPMLKRRSRPLASAEATAPPEPPGPPGAWLADAVLAAQRDERPMIALVIDDLGPSRRLTARALALPPPVTAAFLPYADDLAAQTAAARAAGHELLVHVPMEPLGPDDPGPGALLLELDPGERAARLRADLARFDGHVGVNNHMGSRLTADRAAMAEVMAELAGRGLLFLDSRTSPASVADRAAEAAGVPWAVRDVFIDDVDEPGAIARMLQRLERVARDRGSAIGIGHPRPATLAALERWRPAAEAQGLAFVPLSVIVAARWCTGGVRDACRIAVAARSTP